MYLLALNNEFLLFVVMTEVLLPKMKMRKIHLPSMAYESIL